MSYEVTVTLPCSKCNSSKPIDAFRKRPGRSENGKRRGRWSCCKRCESDATKTPRGKMLQKERGLRFRMKLKSEDYAEYRRREREQNLRRKYGFGQEEYDKLVDSQNGLCAICKRPPSKGRGKRLHVDHDHTTGNIRGLLCGSCNTSLGGFMDDTDLLESAIMYLKNSKAGLVVQV